MAYPRWSYEGFRIAYFSENTLRVIWGNGEHDRSLGAADPSVPPAWQPGTHTVAWLGADGDVRVADADDGRPPARTPASSNSRLLSRRSSSSSVQVDDQSKR